MYQCISGWSKFTTKTYPVTQSKHRLKPAVDKSVKHLLIAIMSFDFGKYVVINLIAKIRDFRRIQSSVGDLTAAGVIFGGTSGREMQKFIVGFLVII